MIVCILNRLSPRLICCTLHTYLHLCFIMLFCFIYLVPRYNIIIADQHDGVYLSDSLPLLCMLYRRPTLILYVFFILWQRQIISLSVCVSLASFATSHSFVAVCYQFVHECWSDEDDDLTSAFTSRPSSAVDNAINTSVSHSSTPVWLYVPCRHVSCPCQR